MISVRYANAMKEVLEYLKGIREDDINKIPKEFILFLEENASTDYNCSIDYTKPLKELELLDESIGIIGMICYNYWCETEEEKRTFLNKLNENEEKFQEELRKKYNPNNIFNNSTKRNSFSNVELNEKNTGLVVAKKSKTAIWYKKIIEFLKNLIK